jgi:hypothetical protein
LNKLLIKETYREISELPLPFGGGKEVNGIDLTLLDADIVGLASRADQIAQFNQEDKVAFSECQKELETVFPHLTDLEAAYFSKHLLICNEMAKSI